MKYITLLALLAIASCGFLTSKRGRELNDYLKKHAPYKVYDPETNPFRDFTSEELRQMLIQTEKPKLRPEDYVHQEPPKPVNYDTYYDFFDSYPACQTIILNQRSCGSCWAHASVSSLGYRFCRANSTAYPALHLSPQYLVSCDGSSYGCNGGHPYYAFNLTTSTGIPTEACYPYTSYSGAVADCVQGSCTASGQTYHAYYTSGMTLKWSSASTYFKEMLYNEGPVCVGFDVYSDFYSYSSGIYEYVSGSYVGGHEVTLVGWGVENGVEYWRLQNSWGAYWGESGFFRMKTDNTLNMDTYWAVGPTPNLSS